jgi:DNA-binding CsgD family transcriptional regulator
MGQPTALEGWPFPGDLLDHIDQALLLIDESCQVVHANAAGRAALEFQSVLMREGERIVPINPSDRQAWRQAVDEALHGRSRLYETHAHGTRHLISITPFQPRDGQIQRKHVVVLLGPTPAPQSRRLEAFAIHCGLTPAETRVFLTLIDDLPPNDIALRLGVAPATVRTHIRRILHKTGSPSMRSLLALISRLPQSRRSS